MLQSTKIECSGHNPEEKSGKYSKRSFDRGGLVLTGGREGRRVESFKEVLSIKPCAVCVCMCVFDS